jgi:hypothetical protein
MDLCPAITDSETMANRQLIPWARLSVICLPIAAIAACEGGDDTRDERESKTMLEVYRTVAQPTDPAIGTNMEIRARGGLRVAISTHPGTHFVAGGNRQTGRDGNASVRRALPRRGMRRNALAHRRDIRDNDEAWTGR